MSLVAQIKEITAKSIESIYKVPVFADDIAVNATKPEFEGEYTVVLFPFVKSLRKAPEALGNEIGQHLQQANPDLVTGFNVIKGFLNLSVSDAFFTSYLTSTNEVGNLAPTGKKVMVEYSSPNTNKPLHLGHLRNNFLGWSVAEILKASGNEVMKTSIVNDRGVHICKSMIDW